MDDLTYPEVGATRALALDGTAPPGYETLMLRRDIGRGRALFEQVAADIRGYRMQRGTHIFVSASTPTAEPGTELTVRLGPILAPCRVVYVLDEPDLRGFAYGTRAGHPESGEELFAARYDPTTDRVEALTVSFSRPATWYTRLARPATRLVQRLVAAWYLRTVSQPQVSPQP
jgi:uncharacterized protein (UPF0548 family)